MKSQHINTLIIALIATLFITEGCTKVNNTNPTAYLGLHLHTYIYSNVVDPVLYPSQYFTDANGRKETLTMAQFYISNVSLRNKSTQQWYTIPNSLILKRIQNELYPIGNAPAGTYDAMGFTVGLGNVLNGASPSTYSSGGGPDTVLSTTEISPMWGSGMTGMNGAASGYTFMNIQGYDSTYHTAFSYQLGGYGDTVQIVMPYPAGFTINANEPNVVQYIHVLADYGKLLQNANFVTAPNGSFYSPTPANVNNATSVWTNIINIFRYECPTPNGNC